MPDRLTSPRPPARRAAALLLAAGITVLAACASLPGFGGGGRSTRFWGFTAPWDPRSAASTARHGASLDALVTGWVALDSTTGMPRAVYRDSAARADGASRPARMMLVTSYAGERFHAEVVRALGAAAGARAASAGAVARLARDGGYRGIVLDLEALSTPDLSALVAVVRAVADSARALQVGPVAVAVPAADTAGYPSRALVAAGADRLLVMLYDEHWSGSAPGPVASPEWARRQLATRVADVGASRIVASLPLYGYLWRPAAPADVVGYADAVRVAAQAGLPLDRDPASSTLRAGRPDGSQVWVADAGLLRVLVEDAERIGVREFALWRLGLEDPAVWDVIGK